MHDQNKRAKVRVATRLGNLDFSLPQRNEDVW